MTPQLDLFDFQHDELQRLTDAEREVYIAVEKDGIGHRYESIEQAANFYGVSKTKAVLFACDDIHQLVEGVKTVLSRGDPTPDEKAEIAETFAAHGFDITINETVSVDLE